MDSQVSNITIDITELLGSSVGPSFQYSPTTFYHNIYRS